MQLPRMTVLNQRNVYPLWLLAFLLLHLFSYCDGCRGNNCSECITSGEDCAWCSDRNFTLQRLEDSRCGSESELMSKNCSKIENPKTTEDTFKRIDNIVTDGASGNGTDAVQIQPQKMHVRIRPKGKGHNITVTFRPANNFPVDLYFLFDVSFTMKTYIQDLAHLAQELARDIGNISTNYRMGFGTFQDKVILPFTNTHPAVILNPCSGCSKAFSFRHELELTQDLSAFTNTVQRANFTGNIDAVEGGFDALMQIIACSSVGWRENSRQIIIFASDERMHFAGDGKLAGIIKPNDGKCHLVNNENVMAEKQDYPSVGQISHALDQTKKFVIFAISKDATYRDFLAINRSIPRSTVEKLELSSTSQSSILSIVRNKYREMTKGVRLTSSPTPDYVKVNIAANHPNAGPEGSVKLNIGESVTFSVTVSVEKCPERPQDRTQTVIISPSDFLKDTLNVTLEIICDCDCQKTDSSVPAQECHYGNGSIMCGICSCFPGRLGERCECNSEGLGEVSVSDANCIDPRAGNKTAVKCSGFGRCKCGVCDCDHQRSGRFCECNDAFCPTNRNGLVCSGNGACKCERCECKQNFTGDICECPVGNDHCFAAPSAAQSGAQVAKVCSGHGNCTCGECVCEEGYTGRHCQICYQCGKSICEVSNYDQCAICHVLPEQQKCPDDCPNVEIVQEVLIQDEVSGQENCKSWRSEECHVRYVVRNPGVNATILVEQSQVCTEGPDLLIIVLGVVGGVVGVGLILLLLVKLLTTLFDRLEYQHFLKELQSPKWAKQNNPIYVKATTTYHNPALNKE